ncbi:hypothetical protein FB451DRAFT_1452371 [Mycena latifolia]|nr:hypothetical protein FB451DRAFT_1452371 [Mycena latifolia]
MAGYRQGSRRASYHHLVRFLPSATRSRDPQAGSILLLYTFSSYPALRGPHHDDIRNTKFDASSNPWLRWSEIGGSLANRRRAGFVQCFVPLNTLSHLPTLSAHSAPTAPPSPSSRPRRLRALLLRESHAAASPTKTGSPSSAPTPRLRRLRGPAPLSHDLSWAELSYILRVCAGGASPSAGIRPIESAVRLSSSICFVVRHAQSNPSAPQSAIAALAHALRASAALRTLALVKACTAPACAVVSAAALLRLTAPMQAEGTYARIGGSDAFASERGRGLFGGVRIAVSDAAAEFPEGAEDAGTAEDKDEPLQLVPPGGADSAPRLVRPYGFVHDTGQLGRRRGRGLSRRRSVRA